MRHSKESPNNNAHNGTTKPLLDDLAPHDPEELPPIIIEHQYIKDFSFENPHPMDFFKSQSNRPDINIHIDVHAEKATGLLQEDAEEHHLYEVVLNIEAQAVRDNQKLFVIELGYGGVFRLNVPADSIQPILLIECPRLLFPFARHIISNATRDGGFPPLMLHPVDFVGLYHQQFAQKEDEPLVQ